VSQENVEIVRRLFERVARRDAMSVLEAYDPEVEWDFSRGHPVGGLIGSVYRGHEGLKRFFREWYDAWEKVDDHCEELIDAGDKVVSAVTNRGRGRASGAEVAFKQYAVWTIREGKIVRVAWFPTRAEAHEAAGLPQSGLARD
jgi:ketosteroid isomerase-like protein